MDYHKERVHARLLITPYNSEGIRKIEESCKVAFRAYANPHEGEKWTCATTGFEYDTDLCMASRCVDSYYPKRHHSKKCWTCNNPNPCKDCDKEYELRLVANHVQASDLDKEMIPRLVATIRELEKFLRLERQHAQASERIAEEYKRDGL